MRCFFSFSEDSVGDIPASLDATHVALDFDAYVVAVAQRVERATTAAAHLRGVISEQESYEILLSAACEQMSPRPGLNEVEIAGVLVPIGMRRKDHSLIGFTVYEWARVSGLPVFDEHLQQEPAATAAA